VEDAAVLGGLAIAVAASADAAWSLYTRFAVDFAGLSALERAAAALWDFRPLATVVFTAGALIALASLPARTGRLATSSSLLAVLAAAHAALALPVLAAAVWVAATGRLGGPDELGFVYSPGERTVTLATQVAAWVPMAGALGYLAVFAARVQARAKEEPAEAPPTRSLGDEMEDLWREQLAFGPGRERGRALLGRIRALEAAGDAEGARELADELRDLARR
jgi:hypothetical protein